jgi:hypothetical protein
VTFEFLHNNNNDVNSREYECDDVGERNPLPVQRETGTATVEAGPTGLIRGRLGYESDDL